MKTPHNKTLAFALALALVFWTLIFGLKVVNFWLGMAVAASTLACIAILDTGTPFRREDFTVKAVLWGVGSAAALYGVFWAGNLVSRAIFAFAPAQLSDVYAIRSQGELWAIACVLLFVTSPAEEIFWRGFVQRWAQAKCGGFIGWLVAGGIYAAVHIASLNLMLTLAALVAGLFWGLLYWKTRNLFACALSHALWTVSVFLCFPFD